MTKEFFGTLIKKQRKKLGISAEKLAKSIGVDRTYISKIENHNLLPSIQTLHKISAELGGMPELQNVYFRLKLRKDLNKPALIQPPKKNKVIDKEFLQMRDMLDDYIMNKKGSQTKPFILNLLKRFTPDKATDKKTINSLIDFIKKWRNNWYAYSGEIDNLIDSILKD